jgi:hypothetical protein
MIHQKRTACRACGNNNLKPFLELGPTPLANAFLKTPDEFSREDSFPLDVYFCENCSLVQLLDVIDPEVLFRDYIYVTGTSETMAAHNQKYAQTVVDLQQLTADDLVVEVASNDGSLLHYFKQGGVKTLGVEPARNIAEMARQKGIETVNEFFNTHTAAQVRADYGPAKAVIANNVLAHVDDTQDFLRGCKTLLAENGLVIIEAPYLKELLDRLEYDTIYHEHLCYFSVTALLHLCDAVGLSIVRIDHVPVHGGSLRMYAGAKEDYPHHADDVLAQATEENKLGMTGAACYDQFAQNVADNRQAVLDLLNQLKLEGKDVAAYGAPAKGNTLLNYCNIGPDLIAYTVDRNPMKVNMYTPGMHIPVRPVSALVADQPDYVLILAWNFAPEIIRQQQEYRDRGGKFIIPIPEPKVV